MTPALHADLEQLGFLARTQRLTQLGHSRRAIERAVSEGWLLRPVRPWLATMEASRDSIVAILNRGMLTNASALASHEVWRGLDQRVHVLVPENARTSVATLGVPLTTFGRRPFDGSGLVRHWGAQRAPLTGEHDWRVSVVDALVSFGASNSAEFLVAAIDSALHTNKLRPSELPLLFSLLPTRHASLALEVDGRAEAGTESLARLRLRRLAGRVEIQVEIGRHRVDILIDGWLVIEIQSEEWHGRQRLEDSQRATWLESHGYRAMSFDYAEVMFEWEKCEAAVAEALRRPPGVIPR